MRKERRNTGGDKIHFQIPISEIEQKGDMLRIAGYASTPDLDSYNDVVEPKAFAKEGALDRYLKNPVILLSHDHDRALGTMIENRVDNGGRWIKAELKYNIDNIFEQILDGVTKGFSIGFIPRKISLYNMDGVPLSELTSEQLDELTYNDVKRVISELEVFEVSVVNVPANPSTLFTLTKALKSYFTNLDDTKMNGEVIIKDAETKEILEEIEVKEVIEKEVEEKDGEAMSTDDVETKEEKVVEEKEIGGEEDDDEELEVEEEEVADEVTEDTEEEVEEEAPETEAPAEEADQDSEKSMSELREKVAQLEDLLDKSLEAYETLAEKHIELAEAVGSLPVNKAYAVVGGQKEAKEVKGELARAREVALG